MQQLTQMTRSRNRLHHWFAMMITIFLAPNLWAQTTQANILGFEGTQYWSTTAGILTSTTVHSQGNSALALNNISYATLTSAPLSTLAGVSPEFEIDVQLPAGISWGQVQLHATSPTLGLGNTWIGSANLSNLPANQFHKLQIPVTTTIQNKLKENYSDLVLKVVFDVPYTTAPIIVDNLRFSTQCVQSAFNLVVTVEGVFDNQTLEKMKCTFHTVYPLLVARFNPNAPQTVYMDIKNVKPIAYADGDHIVFQREYMTKNPHDTDVVVHEAMHIVQGYNFGNTPGWLTEGIADFVRNIYGLSNIGWSLPQYRYGQHYTQGYGTTATFLQWIDTNYPSGGGDSRVDQLNYLLRTGEYTDTIWIHWTTHDIATLWHLYSVEKGTLYNELPSPLPAQQGIVIYEHSNFGGNSYRLDVGNYKPIDLTARGVPGSWFEENNDSGVSSVSVPNGYRVTLYNSNDLSGTGASYTQDIDFVGSTLNDNVNSIKVELVP